jgi:uncharacterized protein
MAESRVADQPLTQSRAGGLLRYNELMQRDDALRLLRERREQLRALGVDELFLYGSVARNQAREDSDVDLLVEPVNQKFSIFDLVRVRDLCRAILGTDAEVHDYDGLRRLPEFRRRVGDDLVRVF